jgi:hypothetical protein
LNLDSYWSHRLASTMGHYTTHSSITVSAK